MIAAYTSTMPICGCSVKMCPPQVLHHFRKLRSVRLKVPMLFAPCVILTLSGRDQVHLAVRPDGGEPGVLEDLAIDGDGVAGFEMRGERRVALGEGTQQLAHILRLDFEAPTRRPPAASAYR